MNSIKAAAIATLPECSVGMFGTCQMTDTQIMQTRSFSRHYSGKTDFCLLHHQQPADCEFWGQHIARRNKRECSVEMISELLQRMVLPATCSIRRSLLLSLQRLTYTTSTTTQTFDLWARQQVPPANSAKYTGTATVVKNAAGTLNSSMPQRQLAADGVSHAYNQWQSTWLALTHNGMPAGAPTGYALGKI